jgi:hypothetical protein
MWTTLERRSALANAITRRRAYVLPVRLDDTQLDGLLPTVDYVDAKRIGLSGLVEAIKMKVSGAEPTRPSTAMLDGKVPRSQEAVEALMTERTGFWEYLLYAGLLKQNMAKLEPKYQDFAMGYAPRGGVHVPREDLSDFVQLRIAAMRAIVMNFEVVLDKDRQERAFGGLGETGDVDRILHHAERFVSVYEDFMDWATELRSASTETAEGTEVLRVLAKWAEQPVETCRSFVAHFVAQMDSITERLDAGEDVEIVMSVKLELDEELVARVAEALRATDE